MTITSLIAVGVVVAGVIVIVVVVLGHANERQRDQLRATQVLAETEAANTIASTRLQEATALNQHRYGDDKSTFEKSYVRRYFDGVTP